MVLHHDSPRSVMIKVSDILTPELRELIDNGVEIRFSWNKDSLNEKLMEHGLKITKLCCWKPSSTMPLHNDPHLPGIITS